MLAWRWNPGSCRGPLRNLHPPRLTAGMLRNRWTLNTRMAAGGGEVSMSWGGSEYPDETTVDPIFTET